MTRRPVGGAHGADGEDGTSGEALDGQQPSGGNEFMLRAEGTDHVLRARGEGVLLREGQDDGDLRLSVDAAAGGGRGDETEVAWQQFHLRLRAFVSRRVRQRADADDIVQKVFMEMHRSLPTLRTRDHLGGWLYRTARNAVTDYYRTPAHRREMPAGDTRDLEVPSPWLASNDDDDVAESALAADCLTPMVQRLPDVYRRAIEFVELRGMTQRVAAETEGVSVSGMKSRVQRARERLRAALLRCCEITLDGRGAVLSCESHEPRSEACGCRATNGALTSGRVDR